VGYRGTCWNTVENPTWNRDSAHKLNCQGLGVYEPPTDAPPELQHLCFFPQRDDSGPPNAVEPKQGP